MAELVTALAGGEPGNDLLELAGAAAGNPLYVTELVAALARGGRLTVTNTGHLGLASGDAPASLTAAIADRLDFLSAPTRDVLQAAALLGVDFAVPDLTIVLDRHIADLKPAIDEARAAGILAESASGLSFRHPLIQAALYDAIAAPVRAEWHRTTGRALAHALAPIERVAQATAGGVLRARPTRSDGRLVAGLAGRHRRRAGRPGTPGGSRSPPVTRWPAARQARPAMACC